MQTYYGFPHEAWGRARDELADILSVVARKRRTITYTEVVQQIRSIHVEPHSHALAALLCAVSSDDDEHGKGMRSALVVSKDEYQPGSGFFALAESRGHDVSDPMKYWVGMLNRVYEDWGSGG